MHSSRPEAAHQEALPSLGDEKKHAYLWQDPFAAVAAGQSAAGSKGEKNTADATAIGDVVPRSNADSKEKTLVLPVMVMGAGYGVERERRRRSRFAVVSALFHSGYVSDAPQHIGYFNYPPLPAPIPFERFHRPSEKPAKGEKPPEGGIPSKPTEGEKRKYRNVVVLWLPDELFGQDPFANIERLFDCSGLLEGKAAELVVLGPGGSGTLSAMVKELENDGRSWGCWRAGQGTLHFISPWSTVEPQYLGDKETRSISQLFREKLGPSTTFTRSVKTDNLVCEELAAELFRRKIDSDLIRGGTIVVLSEWDTLYGRALPKSFESAVKNSPVKDSSKEKIEVRHRRYLRELDGIGYERNESQTEAKRGEIDRDEIRRAEGTGQYDYVRRLADELKAFDREERRKWNGKPIRAVGVLGSDVYDKILLLQALRPHLPDTIFFTTDLEVALTHPSQSKWARNLVVASSYGLQLDQEFQGEQPPFRDSYQTSLYASALCALGKLEILKLPGVNHGLPVKVFEIGEFEPVDLTAAPAPPAAPDSDLSSASAQPPLADWLIRFALLLLPFLAAAIPFYLMLAFGYKRIKAIKKETCSEGSAEEAGNEYLTYRKWWNLLTAAAAVFFFGFMLALFSEVLGSGDGEPLGVLNGTSAWVTEAIRLAAAFLALWWGVWGMIRLTDDERRLSKDFGLFGVYRKRRILVPQGDFWRQAGERLEAIRKIVRHPSAPWKAPKEKCRRVWNSCLESVSGFGRFMTFAPKPPGGGVSHPREVKNPSASIIWNYYLYNTDLIRFRFHRSAWGWAVIIFLAAVALTWIWHWPYAPLRGDLAFWVDIVCLLVSQITILALIYLVAWAARRCSGLAGCLADCRACWPVGTYENLGLPPELARSVPSGEKRGIARDVLSDWLTIEFLSRRTSLVGNLIIYPFVVIAIQIFARNRIFDAWTWPLPLILAYAGTAFIAVYFAIGLRRAAERARHNVLERLRLHEAELNSQSFGTSGDNDPPMGELKGLLHWVRSEVEGNARGAFSPISKNPILVAVLVPFGGVGSLAFVEWAVRLAA